MGSRQGPDTADYGGLGRHKLPFRTNSVLHPPANPSPNADGTDEAHARGEAREM